MWKDETWAFGRNNRRLGWNRSDVELFRSVQDALLVRVVLAADKKLVRKGKSVSISGLNAVTGCFVSTPNPQDQIKFEARLVPEVRDQPEI
jgi:hypothetical protein